MSNIEKFTIQFFFLTKSIDQMIDQEIERESPCFLIILLVSVISFTYDFNLTSKHMQTIEND